jgi:hypothetical protein
VPVPSCPLGTWERVADNVGTAVGTPRRGRQPMSVHAARGAWVVRWRENRRQRSRRFPTEAEAVAFEEGMSGGAVRPRSSTPNVYPYETSAGTRWRYTYRDSRGRASSRRGFGTERSAARDRSRPSPASATVGSTSAGSRSASSSPTGFAPATLPSRRDVGRLRGAWQKAPRPPLRRTALDGHHHLRRAGLVA